MLKTYYTLQVHGVPKDQITLVFGEHDRNQTDESQTQYRKIESFVKHPQFQRATFNNDIAVLRLDRPIRFNRYISPACLPLEYGNFFIHLILEVNSYKS